MLWPTIIQMPKTWCKTLSLPQNMVSSTTKVWHILGTLMSNYGKYCILFYIQMAWYYTKVQPQNILCWNGLILWSSQTTKYFKFKWFDITLMSNYHEILHMFYIKYLIWCQSQIKISFVEIGWYYCNVNLR